MELSSRLRTHSAHISASSEFAVLKRLLVQGAMGAPAAAQQAATRDSSRWKRALKQDDQLQPIVASAWKLEQAGGLTVIGLGSLAQTNARSEQRLSQLALSLAIREGLMHKECFFDFFDPAFSQDDISLITDMGGRAFDKAYDSTLMEGMTGNLYYMPCCSRSLVRKIVADIIASGSPAAILGNSFQSFVDSTFLLDDEEERAATQEIKSYLTTSRVREILVPDIACAHRVATSLHIIS